jgi:hypothetical protein
LHHFILTTPSSATGGRGVLSLWWR